MSDVNNLELIQAKLPHWYKKYEKDKSVLYAVISALAKELDISSDLILRLDDMLGIETTRDEDLEYRWGSLLNMPKSANESYDDYRYKLMMTYSALMNGGTVESLKFAIASILGVNRRTEDIDEYIKVYDAWDYDGVIQGYNPTVAKYGSFVCTVDFRILENVSNYYDKLYDALNKTKASGTVPYFMIIYLSDDIINVRFDSEFIDCIRDIYGEDGLVSKQNSDVIFNNISYIITESGEIHSRKTKMFDRMSQMITNQDKTNEYIDTDAEFIDIKESSEDTGRLKQHTDRDHIDKIDIFEVKDEPVEISHIENLLDHASSTIQDEQNLRRQGTGMWSGLRGTNSSVVVLNTDLTTNILMDTDECLDVIKLI